MLDDELAVDVETIQRLRIRIAFIVFNSRQLRVILIAVCSLALLGVLNQMQIVLICLTFLVSFDKFGVLGATAQLRLSILLKAIVRLSVLVD